MVEQPGSRGPYAKSASLRHRIVVAATAEFAAKGYHGGSLRKIAADLSLSVTSVSHHFGSKGALLLAVLDHTDDLGASFIGSHPDDGLSSTLLPLIERNLATPNLLRLLAVVAAEASAEQHPAHEWFLRRYRRLSTWIASGVAAERAPGEAPDAEDLAAARDIIAAWDGHQLQWLLDPELDMVAAMRRSLLAITSRRAN